MCAGTYGPVFVTDVDGTIEGVDGAEATVIDGGPATALRVSTRSVVLRGVTLRGVAPANSAAAAVGTDATLSFDDVRFDGSTSGSTAGCTVVQLDGSDTTFDDTWFVDNESSSAGIYAFGGGSLTIQHSVFTGTSYDPAAQRTRLLIVTGGLDVEIANNLVYDNISTDSLLYVCATDDATWLTWVYDNVFYGNQVRRDVLVLGAYADFQNNIVANNVGGGMGNFEGYEAVCRYSDFYDNSEGDVGPMNETEECISLDPRFVDPNALDFTLEAGFSPCVDAGNPLSGYDDGDGSRNDMGAFGGPEGSGW